MLQAARGAHGGVDAVVMFEIGRPEPPWVLPVACLIAACVSAISFSISRVGQGF